MSRNARRKSCNKIARKKTSNGGVKKRKLAKKSDSLVKRK